MARGRKKLEDRQAKDKIFAFRITQEEQDLLKKNDFIKKEAIELFRNYLKIYLEK